jgi:hypothetical protein
LIRQIAALGGDVERLDSIIPPLVIERLKMLQEDYQQQFLLLPLIIRFYQKPNLYLIMIISGLIQAMMLLVWRLGGQSKM